MRRIHRMERLRNRTGATLVVVVILLFALVGIAGIAIDFSRMYAFRAQLQTTADASAQAAAVDLLHNLPLSAAPRALAFRDSNLVNSVPAEMNPIDVEGGSWDDATLTFTKITDGTTTAGWDNSSVNAVLVRARYTGNTTLSRLFGRDVLSTGVQAIGAIGYVGSTSCLHPWGVSYMSLLKVLFPPNGPPEGVAYNLTPADVDSLAKATSPSKEIRLLSGNSDPLTPGNIVQVEVNDPWEGSYYGDAIEQNKVTFPPDGCPNLPVGPGMWLLTEQGVGGGLTKNPLKVFCDANGGTTGGTKNFHCLGEPRVKLALWDISTGEPGNNLQVRVKYVGVFAITRYHQDKNEDQIYGYFTAMASEGSFSGTPGPLQKIALVR